MKELKIAKQELEQEVDSHKTRLRIHMEAQVRTKSNTFLKLFLTLVNADCLFHIPSRVKLFKIFEVEL